MIRQTRYGNLSFRLSWAFFAVVSFLLVKGYSFNGGDQEEHLPYVYRLLNPELYPHDYLVPFQASNFTVRFYYAHLVALVAGVFPVWLTVLSFHVFCLLIFAWATGVMALGIARSELAFILAPVSTLVVFNSWTAGGNTIMDNQLTCSVFAMAAGSVAALYAYRKWYKGMAVLAGIAALFQVLIGLQLFILLWLVAVFTNRGGFRIREKLISAGLFMVFAGPMLFPIIWRQFFIREVHDQHLYDFVLFEFRNRHHYLPSFFPTGDYVKTVLLVVFTGVLSFLGFLSDYRRYYGWLSGIVAAGCILYFVLFEVAGLSAIGKIQWFKTTAWVTWAGGVAVAAWIGSLRFMAALTAKILKAHVYLPLGLSTVMLLFMISGERFSTKIPLRYQLFPSAITDQQIMHQWILKNTPLDCIVLIPPDNERFLCEAQRSVPVAWKGIVHEPGFLIQWYHDFREAYGPFGNEDEILPLAAANYRRKPDAAFQTRIRPDYRLYDLGVEGRPVPDSLVVFRAGNQVLTFFRKGN